VLYHLEPHCLENLLLSDLLVQMGYLFGGSVICSRWVLDVLQLLQGCVILLWGVKAEDAPPHCSHSLHEEPFSACSPSVVRRGASAFWKLLFL
jgi:hypothetical protein